MSRSAVVLCLLCAFLVLSSPALALPTVDELFKMMTEKAAELRTMQGDVNVVANSSGYQRKGTGGVVSAKVYKDGKITELYFSSIKMVVKDEKMAVTLEVKTINDGRFVWQEVGTPTSPLLRVTKVKVDRHLSAGADCLLPSTERIQQLRKQFDFKEIAEDVMDGGKVYVLEGVARAAQPNMTKVFKVKLYVDQADSFTRRVVSYDETDKEVSRFELTNVKIDEPVDSKLFEYTPPEGAEVTDLLDQSADQLPTVDELLKMMTEKAATIKTMQADSSISINMPFGLTTSTSTWISGSGLGR